MHKFFHNIIEMLCKCFELKVLTKEEAGKMLNGDDTSDTVIYVPVSDGYSKPYQKRWEDKSYLGAVAKLSQNNCLTSELINTLSRMRDVADTAKTPQELSGVNRCILEVKQLISVSQRASDALSMLAYKQGLTGGNDAPTR